MAGIICDMQGVCDTGTLASNIDKYLPMVSRWPACSAMRILHIALAHSAPGIMKALQVVSPCSVCLAVSISQMALA